MIQISINLMSEVCGSFEEIELLRVYMTNIAVMETGMAVLKCSLLKYRVACKDFVVPILIACICYYLSNDDNAE